MRSLTTVFVLMFGVFALLWAFIVEPHFMLVRDNINIVSDKWPSNLDGMKVLVAGDFHTGKYPWERRRLRRAIDAIKAEKADVIFLVGDYINQSRYSKERPKNMMDLNEMEKYFSELSAPCGVFAIFGNHDLNFRGAKEIGAMLERAGITVLKNSLETVHTGKGSFAVYGALGTPYTSGASDRAIRKVPENLPVIALTHSPDGIIALSGRPVAVFAGHTHGGQIRLPYGRPIVTNSNLGSNYADGLVDMGDSFLYTTRGLGTSRIPARFACPPTISIVRFYSPSSGVKPSPARPGVDAN